MADCIRPAMAALEVEAAGLKAEDARALCSMLLLESVRARMASRTGGIGRACVIGCCSS